MARSMVQTARAAVATAALLGLAACGSAQGSEGSTKSTAPDPTLLRDGTLGVCTSHPKAPFAFEQGGELVGGQVGQRSRGHVAKATEDDAGLRQASGTYAGTPAG